MLVALPAVTANLDSPCARRLTRHVGQGGETGFQVEQRNWDEVEKETVMDASNPITAAVFSAFLKCPTKAHLLAIGEPAPGTFFADIEARISSMYKAVAKRRSARRGRGSRTSRFRRAVAQPRP